MPEKTQALLPLPRQTALRVKTRYVQEQEEETG
jgi:hypothetical protein